MSRINSSVFEQTVKSAKVTFRGLERVLYTGRMGEDCQAVKEYERMCFPFDPKSYVYMNANTWGSRGAGIPSQDAAAAMQRILPGRSIWHDLIEGTEHEPRTVAPLNWLVRCRSREPFDLSAMNS